jgi:hypothetical protein
MALVEFTPRAEQSVLELLGRQNDDALLVVDMSREEVELSFKSTNEMLLLQRDVDLVGPFRVPIGGHEMSLFVRERDAMSGDAMPGSVYQVDYAAVGGENRFRIRERDPAATNG